ncbi:MAG TPA: AmmeMemoRadiSam system radical SAM enzyme [Desulfuromonadaceae bacterium]
MREASFYTKQPDGSVVCALCRHRCHIAAGKRGICHVRENREGTLFSLVYGRVVAEHADPIEKKPLFHYLPASRSYSIATVGCNFRCRHCQNYTIAQHAPDANGGVPGRTIAPEEIVARALAAGCRSISYTYTEPTIFLEYALDVARLASKAGLKNIFVTNGYITPEALDAVAPFLDAANIDLKGFSEGFYQRVVGARLDEVLECIRDYHRRGIWIELTTLVIPGENDDPAELEGIAAFIAQELGPDVPWHISRFFPQHRMTDLGPTPAATLSRAVEAGHRAGLRYIYEGNIAGGREDTACSGCGRLVVRRSGFRVLADDLRDGACRQCGTRVAGVW